MREEEESLREGEDKKVGTATADVFDAAADDDADDDDDAIVEVEAEL